MNHREYFRQLASNFVEQVFCTMGSVVVVVDEYSNVIYWNKEAETLLGIKAEEALGKNVITLIPQLIPDQIIIDSVIEKRKKKTYTKFLPRKGKTDNRVELSIHCLRDKMQKGALVIINEKTTCIRTEEILLQAQKILSSSGCFASATHEINNYLMGLNANITLIKTRLDTQDPINLEEAKKCNTDIHSILQYLGKRNVLDFLEKLNETSERIGEIVHRVLHYSRKADCNPLPHDLTDLCERVINLLENSHCSETHYDFRTIKIIRKYESINTCILCDGGRIQQALFNLMKNSAQAMADTTKNTVQSQLILRIRNGKRNVHLEIEDSGPGIAEEMLDSIFEPFFTTKEPGAGTGLGLAVCKYIIVDNHGGTLKVKSKSGKGAKFTVSLPLLSKPQDSKYIESSMVNNRSQSAVPFV